jgi:hypothetical protein
VVIWGTRIARAAVTLQGHDFAGEGALRAEKGVHRKTFNSEMIEVKTR